MQPSLIDDLSRLINKVVCVFVGVEFRPAAVGVDLRVARPRGRAQGVSELNKIRSEFPCDIFGGHLPGASRLKTSLAQDRRLRMFAAEFSRYSRLTRTSPEPSSGAYKIDDGAVSGPGITPKLITTESLGETCQARCSLSASETAKTTDPST